MIKPDFCITPLSWCLCPTIVFLFSLNQTTKLSKKGSTLGSHIKSLEASGVKLAKETLVLMGLAIYHLSFFSHCLLPLVTLPYFLPPSLLLLCHTNTHTLSLSMHTCFFLSFFFFFFLIQKWQSSLLSLPLMHLTVSILTSDLIFNWFAA